VRSLAALLTHPNTIPSLLVRLGRQAANQLMLSNPFFFTISSPRYICWEKKKEEKRPASLCRGKHNLICLLQ